MFRINFETNSAQLIIEWNDGLGRMTIDDCTKGAFLYVPSHLYQNSTRNNIFKDRDFLAIYLDREINNENWTQYIRSYEKGQVPSYGNRWTELFNEYSTESSEETIHLYRSDLNCNFKYKLDQIRNCQLDA